MQYSYPVCENGIMWFSYLLRSSPDGYQYDEKLIINKCVPISAKTHFGNFIVWPILTPKIQSASLESFASYHQFKKKKEEKSVTDHKIKLF